MKDTLGRLYARAPLGMRLGTDAIRAACARLGSPERRIGRIVHVAGTNGKGSVSAMVAAIGEAAGLRVGLYTSPHLSEFRERIRVNGLPVDNVTLARVLDRALDDPDLSFFEAATVAALLAFEEARVDLSVLEVGIGGRLDATSVARDSGRVAVSVLTRVALDHQDRLGTTLDAIAREKAAIGVAGVPLLCGPLDAEAEAAVRDVCAASGAHVVMAMEDLDAGRVAERAPLPLPGAHQVQNAHIAAATARLLGIQEPAIERGLFAVRWPGRLEWIDGEPRLLLDAAHNPDGARALRAYAESPACPVAPRVLLFGALADKDAHAMLDVLAPLAAARIFAPPAGRAPWDPAALARRWGGEGAPDALAGLARARTLALQLGGAILVCGSVYLVGEIRAAALGLARDPPVAL